MKKNYLPGLPLLFALLSLAALPAHGQSTNTIYGLLDTGVVYQNHVGAGKDNLTLIPTSTSGYSPSYIGFTGNEDLGDGLKATYSLETGVAPDTGAALQGGRLFGRQSLVGLGNEYGTLSFGHGWTMLYYSKLDANTMASGAFGFTSFDSYIAIPRADNMISYKGAYGPWQYGATYSLGRDNTAPNNCAGETPGAVTACRNRSAMVKYNTPGWGVALAVDQQNGGAGAGAMTIVPAVKTLAFTDSADKDTRYNADAYVKFEKTKFGVGWFGRRTTTLAGDASSNLVFLAASYAFESPFVLDAQWSTVRQKGLDANGSASVIRGTYILSRRTVVYAMAGYMQNKGSKAAYSVSGASLTSTAPLAGVNQIGFLVGMKHTF